MVGSTKGCSVRLQGQSETLHSEIACNCMDSSSDSRADVSVTLQKINCRSWNVCDVCTVLYHRTSVESYCMIRAVCV